MTFKSIAHAAQQHLQSSCGVAVRRSHVYELIAAAFGFGSLAAFHEDCVLADSGVGDRVPVAGPGLAGRALQLGYPQPDCNGLAGALLTFMQQRHLAALRWDALRSLLKGQVVPQGAPRHKPRADEFELDDDDDEVLQDTHAPTQAGLALPPLLLDELEQRDLDAELHYLLATVLRCRRPNPYLYEESQKGRVLTAVEQAWVDEYLQGVPRFRAYEHHLRRAALCGVRQAAADYARAFEKPEFYELAQRLEGDVDPLQMAAIAPSNAARREWLRVSAQRGSDQSLRELAGWGDTWALEQLARAGDLEAVRDLAVRFALAGDGVRAWAMQHFAATLGSDLTRSDYHAYHSSGERAGEFYDSDFGGPMHIDGVDGIELPAIDAQAGLRAEDLARRFAAGSSLVEEDASG